MKPFSDWHMFCFSSLRPRGSYPGEMEQPDAVKVLKNCYKEAAMAEQIERRNNLSPLVPLFIGGAIAGGIAMMFAPQLTKARDAVCAAGRKTKELMIQRRSQAEAAKSKEGGIYCAVPEGADICFDEKAGS
jgi:hypothetical protein